MRDFFQSFFFFFFLRLQLVQVFLYNISSEELSIEKISSLEIFIQEPLLPGGGHNK